MKFIIPKNEEMTLGSIESNFMLKYYPELSTSDGWQLFGPNFTSLKKNVNVYANFSVKQMRDSTQIKVSRGYHRWVGFPILNYISGNSFYKDVYLNFKKYLMRDCGYKEGEIKIKNSLFKYFIEGLILVLLAATVMLFFHMFIVDPYEPGGSQYSRIFGDSTFIVLLCCAAVFWILFFFIVKLKNKLLKPTTYLIFALISFFCFSLLLLSGNIHKKIIGVNPQYLRDAKVERLYFTPEQRFVNGEPIEGLEYGLEFVNGEATVKVRGKDLHYRVDRNLNVIDDNDKNNKITIDMPNHILKDSKGKTITSFNHVWYFHDPSILCVRKDDSDKTYYYDQDGNEVMTLATIEDSTKLFVWILFVIAYLLHICVLFYLYRKNRMYNKLIGI